MNRSMYQKYLPYALILLLLFSGWVWKNKEEEKRYEAIAEELVQSEVDTVQGTEIFVHITGAVHNPGVYEFSEEKRLVEVLETAGGVTEDAVTDHLNLSQKVKDESKIHVPTREEALQTSPVTGGPSGKVNINTADKETLKTLPGVGDVIAQNILDYRNKNGSFTQIDQLKNVDKIGEKMLENLKDYIFY